MKKIYEKCEIEVVAFMVSDILSTSAGKVYYDNELPLVPISGKWL